jgi:hypothetical protein
MSDALRRLLWTIGLLLLLLVLDWLIVPHFFAMSVNDGRLFGIPIDILFYGNAVIDSPQLTVPHPRAAERRFVLAPLADLAPGFRHPVLRRTMRELLDAAPEQVVRRFACSEPLV